MAGVPHYQITSCCSQATNSGVFIIPGSGTISNGVYVFNGISFLEGTTGMWFYSGFCYEVTYLGTDFSTHPTAFNEADLTLSFANDCASSDCASCEIAIPPVYSIYNCCDASVIVNLNININIIPCSGLDGTWIYIGDGYSTESGFVFTSGDCYSFTRIENGVYENGPDCTDFDVSTRSCAEAQADGDCPACDLGLQYLSFKPCCGGPVIYFRGDNLASYYGVREYLGALVNGLENICYGITIDNVGDGIIPNLAAYNELPIAPAYIETVTFSTISILSTNCNDFTSSCPSCLPLPCYTLYNCAGESFNTTVDLSIYPVNSWLTIANYLGVSSGPWLLTETIGECNDAVNTISVLGGSFACPLTCYEVTGEGEVTYIDASLNVVTDYSPLQFCSYIYPTVSEGIVVTAGGACVNGECPTYCYTLQNCDTAEIIHSNTQSLSQYYTTTNVVTLNGYDGCWRIMNNTGDCTCSVPVTVLTSFVDCNACQPIVAYKFTNCENPALVLYSYNDYSAAVGYSLLLDCDEQCYTVTQIDYAPPVTSVINVLAGYQSCAACLKTYFKLQDCFGIQDDVYTSTDLTQYVGDVIKINDCDTCWNVVSIPYLPLYQTFTVVSIDSSHATCTDCLTSAPCVCSRITNTTSQTISFEYFDCNGELINLRPLDPGQTSNKICLIAWSNYAQENAYIEFFGNCTETDGEFTCPVPKFPPRIVKPGYNTPTCDAEKWDKITCKSSEILYKMVLKARYGISNCCDAPDDKWLIKKELIDLAALVDPNYTCTVSSCGCPTSTCGCGCGSTPKTCNSN